MAVTDLGSPGFALHPLHGVHSPTAGTPPRRAHSVRRTTSIDMTRNEGALDPVYLKGRGRDLVTAADGSATELRHGGLTATVELVSRVIRHVETDPAVAGVARLVGAPAMSGFRSIADEVAPRLRAQRDLLYTLIDDIPVTTLISGHALTASGALGDVTGSGYLPVADQCAGFVTGGLLMNMFEDGDPVIVTGPDAPDLEDPDDPLAWHTMAPLPIHGMRRRRRIDVSHDDSPNVAVDAMFRDTYVRADGQETVIHEYTLVATVNPDSGGDRSCGGGATCAALAGVPRRGRQRHQNRRYDVVRTALSGPHGTHRYHHLHASQRSAAQRGGRRGPDSPAA